MPTFAPFLTNGHFPFCLEKRDVSVFDYWSTLGGFKKGDAGSPTALQIENSLINAGKLFWKLYSVSATDTAFGGGTIDITVNAEDDVDPTLQGRVGAPAFEWVCPIVYNEGALNEARVWGRDLEKEEINSFRDTRLRAGVGAIQFPNNALDPSIRSSIYRMYKGPTSNESNFVGWGCNALSLIANASGDIQIFIISTIDDPDPADGWVADDTKYITFGGIPFVCQVLVSTLADTFSADAANRTGSISNSGDLLSEISIDSMDFYTIT